MGMFRKKPVVIEAHQFLNDESSYALLHWINEGQYKIGGVFAKWHNNTLTIPTWEGDHKANVGDWIIRGVVGEHYPCKPTIFEATYEAANAGVQAAAQPVACNGMLGAERPEKDRYVAVD